MLYYVNYSCGCGDNEEIISTNNKEEATEYAYRKAIENYQSYEGLHGIRGFVDILEEDFGMSFKDEEVEDYYEQVQEVYNEEVENTIDYTVEEYDEEKHGWLLEEQETAYEV